MPVPAQINRYSPRNYPSQAAVSASASVSATDAVHAKGAV